MPVTVVQPGFVNGESKRGSEATKRGKGVGGVFPPPTVGRFFVNSCKKIAFSCTLNAIIRGVGYVKWHIPIPLLPLLKFLLLQLTGRRAAWTIVPLSYASDRLTVVQSGFVNGESKRGSEATERGRVWEGVFPLPRYWDFFPLISFTPINGEEGAWALV